MSKQARRRQPRPSSCGSAAAPFTPVPVRARHDGWLPGRQIAFVQALAACGNVEEACEVVDMSPRSYYDLRSRPDAASFRQAVDAALDLGVHRLAEAMMGRALHGEVTPIFYKGEQVGERRRYDNRLAVFILRTRAAERYGKWRDAMQQHREHPDGAAELFKLTLRHLAQDLTADKAGVPRPARAPLKTVRLMDDPVEIARDAEEESRRADARAREEERRVHAKYLADLDEEFGPPDPGDDEADSGADVARTS